MNILLVGALSWNPERVITLAQKGHHLFGLWSRTMPWEQGPYAFANEVITDVDVECAVDLLHDGTIDLVYSLFQVYDARLWARAASPGVEDLWRQLRRLLVERRRGAFAVPIVRHWGFDVHNLDLDVARALDGQIFCNRQKLRYWTAPRAAGGCGLDLGCDRQAIAFMDSDLPWREFMNDRFSPKLSESDGEIHTVCVGRPLGIDLVSAARQGIHVHVYGNSVDDVATMVARGLAPTGFARLRGLVGRYLHVHPPMQPIGASLADIRRAKDRWVEEFSRYDAGWSYVKRPLPWPRLEDQAAIPNRHGTYLLAGLPIITEALPGFDRYDSLTEHGVAIRFFPTDYARLAADLRHKARLAEMNEKARRCRERFTFDATVDALVGYFERVHALYRVRRRDAHTVFEDRPSGRVQLHTRPVSLRSLVQPRAVPGGLRSRIAHGVQLARWRVSWLFARMMARAYVARTLRQSQPGQRPDPPKISERGTPG
jgi:hypothetical protein